MRTLFFLDVVARPTFRDRLVISVSRVELFMNFSALEAKTVPLSRNARRQSSSDAVPHSRRTEISTALRRKPENAAFIIYLVFWRKGEVKMRRARRVILVVRMQLER